MDHTSTNHDFCKTRRQTTQKQQPLYYTQYKYVEETQVPCVQHGGVFFNILATWLFYITYKFGNFLHNVYDNLQ